VPGGDRSQVAEAILGATRVPHVVIGTFSAARLAIVDADVASGPGAEADARARATSVALLTICRAIGEAHAEPEAGGDGGVAWICSERCMIGMWRKPSETAPFVALIRDRSAHVFPRWQRDVARIGLLYESGRLAWSRQVAPPPPARAALDEILRQLSVACALVDAGRNVLYANGTAHRWIAGQDGLRLADGRLTATAPELQRRLCAAVRAATTDEPRTAQAVVLKGRHRGDLPQVLTCLPLPGAAAQALLILGKGSGSVELADVLLNAFGLTSAERRLACHLLVGRTLEEAAEEARIRVSTARSYLKAIFAKTGVRRQSEFVAVVGALVPPVIGQDEMRATAR
jgi:DNA-binding CsgD family transcriptional regulator